MTLPRRLNRPDFEADEVGYWVDPSYLEPKLRTQLAKLLPKKMAAPAQAQFLSSVGEWVQLEDLTSNGTSAAQVRRELKQVQSRARSLLQAIGQLSQESRRTLRAHAVYLAIGTAPPVRFSVVGGEFASDSRAELFGYFWDAAQDMETAAAYAALQVNPSKTARPSQAKARGLIEAVARAFHRAQGGLPPGSKRGWFAGFMRELGESTGHSIGPAMVEASILGLKRSPEFAKA